MISRHELGKCCIEHLEEFLRCFLFVTVAHRFLTAEEVVNFPGREGLEYQGLSLILALSINFVFGMTEEARQHP